jgi:aminoglycoside phosphotransferase family enzyme/predicted kinase
VADLAADGLRAALERQLSQPVEVRETHISVVYLVGDRAFKRKKPIVLPFLDYGTPERRRMMCDEEVRLGRRLAPDVYLGVRGVSAEFALTAAEDRRAVDYVVEMRRYDEATTLAATLERGELRLPQITELAGRLQRFHADCPPRTAAGARWIELEVMRNVQELLELAALRGERTRIHALAHFIAAFARAHEGLFDARAEAGLVREGHGDLRAEHVLLDADGVSVVDCVEFDPGLRTLDVADDLAFLIMDLHALGGERFGAALLEDYRAAGGDSGPDALVAFFAVHRALIRAKVLLVRASQHPAGSAEHGHAEAQARDLIGLAEQFVWRARLPLVIVVCGVPASGKSTLAAELAERSALPRLSSDLVRKTRAGIPVTSRAPAGVYADAVSHATYAELGREARAAVHEVGGAVVDATFRRLADRRAFGDAFDAAAPALFVECIAPIDVLRHRAAERGRDAGRVSDASVDVVLREARTAEPLDEVPPDRHLPVRSDRPVGLILTDLADLLDRRL